MKYKIGNALIVILLLSVTAAGCNQTSTTTAATTATTVSTPTAVTSVGTTTSTTETTTTIQYITPTSTSTAVNNANSGASSAGNGLRLTLAIDSKIYSPGQQIFISLDEKNTLSVPNKVPVADNWPYSNLAIDQCGIGPGSFGYPYGIAIFQGEFTTADYSDATPLALFDYGMPVPCPGPLPAGVYNFEPLSDIATISGSSAQYPDSTTAITTSLTETGYWTGVRPDTSEHGFGPGVYTIVGGDEWGALVVLHFTITRNTTGDNSVSSLSINGLSLSLTIDTTTYRSGEEATITVDENNTLSTQNNVPTADKWSMSGLSVNPCGTDAFPLGIGIFQGNYTLKTISSATPLNIYNPINTWLCPPQPAIKEYDFQPSSDSVAQIIDGEPNSQTFEMKQSVSASSYWTVTKQTLTQYELHNFEPGVYTVAGGDEWGNLVILHFTVTN